MNWKRGVKVESARWDAVIVNYNGSIFLDPCLRALSRIKHGPARTIVVDNASTDDSITELAGWPRVEVIESSTNLGYAGGANLGVRTSDAPLIVILNPDVELDAGYGTALLKVFDSNPGLGTAGAKLWFPDEKLIQHAGGRVNWPLLTTAHLGEKEFDEGQFDLPRDVDYVTGAALAVRRNAFEMVGGFDESFYPAYWEDVDLCFRLRHSGWSVQYQPELSGVHHEGAGIERGDDYYLAWTRNRLRMAMKHMTSAEWWQEFVPAEMERVRGELSAVESDTWPIRSGAASIEQLARTGGVDSVTFQSELRADSLTDAITTFQALPDLADPRPRDLRPADGVMRRLKRFLSRFSGRLYAEEIYWQQRQFNESLVRAFEAQDRLNRELVAQLLLTLLVVGEHRSRLSERMRTRGADQSGPVIPD